MKEETGISTPVGVIIIVILIALIFTGFFYYKNFSTIGWNTYSNKMFGYSLSYPKNYTAYEWLGNNPYAVFHGVGSTDNVTFTPVVLHTMADTPAIINSTSLGVFRIASADLALKNIKTAADAWANVPKTCVDSASTTPYDCKILVGKESINGVDFVIFKQEGYLANGDKSDTWSMQAFFMYKTYGFLVSSTVQMDKNTFYSILRSFKFKK
jgi:hypothetical protein